MRVSTLITLAAVSAVLAACGGSNEPAKTDAAAALPADVTAFTARAGECLSWSDEARVSGPHADATHEQVMAAWAQNGCETLAADAATLRTTYADNAAVATALNTAMNPPETAGATATGPASAVATPANGAAGLAAFMQKAKTCSETAAEMGDNDEQNAQLNQTWETTGCPALEAETGATRQAYAGNAAVLAQVNAAVDPLGY